MTKHEAVEILEEVKTLDDSMFAYSQAYNDALEMAIEALKAQEPEAVDAPKPDSDIGCWYDITHNYTLEQVVSALKAQEHIAPIQGADDQDEDIFCCGSCGAVVGETFLGPPGECEVRDNYCPECGRAVKWSV